MRELRALVRAAVRELVWGLPTVVREVRAWRARARAIPDAPIRQDALSSLARKRGHTDGAALFTILTRKRDRGLLRLLAAYEIAWDFLDSISERGAAAGAHDGRQLHLALVDALDPDTPGTDYYRHSPWKRDGGYLRAIVTACRRETRALAGYEPIRPYAVQEARRALVLGINHERDPARRDAALVRWAARELPAQQGVAWFELTGAASASLAVHALLALSAEAGGTDAEVQRVRRAYFPWISSATTMLDSYVDRDEDVVNGDHSYVAHYGAPETAARRVGQLVRRCMHEAGALPRGEDHIVIAACMVAMYLSKDSAHTGGARATTARLSAAGGPLVRLLLPALRLWRIAYSQRSA